MTQIDYKYPLHETRDIKDLRDMWQQSVEIFAEETAYLIKDPVALGEVEPRSQKSLTRAELAKREYKPITFKKFGEDLRAFGTGLTRLGLQGNVRIAILSETRYEWYVSYLATVSGVGIVVPLDKEQPDNELESLLTRSAADVLLYSKEKRQSVNNIRANLPNVKMYIEFDIPEEGSDAKYFWDIMQDGRKAYAEGDRTFDELPIDAEGMGILLFTSGTTSRSKGAMLSHRNICANLSGMCKMVKIDENDTFFSVLPLHHTYECTCDYLCQVYRGSTVAVCQGLRYILQEMQEAKPTVILIVPLMLEAFHRQIMRNIKKDPKVYKKFKFGLKLSNALRKIGIDLRPKLFKEIHKAFGGNLRLIIAGGAAISADLIKSMNDIGFEIIQGYGLTECGPILALNRTHYYDNRSAGLPLPGVDVKIINKNEDGIGEILGRGPNVMLGYYEDPEKTKAAIDEEGFYHTGDLGYIDERGFVMITGRKSNLIVTKNGKNIFPEELEFLLDNKDIVAEAVVYGADDGHGDKLVTAEIFPNKEYIVNDPELKGLSLTDDKVKEKVELAVKEINSGLVPYKHIKNVVLRDVEFEKTTSRKIKRY